MRTLSAVVLYFATSVMAYMVTTPNTAQGWTNSGPQPVKWQRVSTDALNFTAVLTNEDRSVMPMNNQVMSALVDGSLLSTTLNPPSGGFPVGDGFRLNFVKDVNEPNTIFAQSEQFSIKAVEQPSKSASSVTPLSTNPTLSSSVVQTIGSNPTGSNSNTATAVAPTDGSSTSDTPAPQTTGKSNDAFPRGDTQVALWSALSLLGGIFLA